MTGDTDILIDLRCLQDKRTKANRSADAARALLRSARARLACRAVLGLTHQSLPPLDAADRALADHIKAAPYTGTLTHPVWLIHPGLPRHGALYHAPLLNCPGVLPIALVDAGGLAGLSLAAGGVERRWLARYRLILCDTEADAAMVRDVVAVAAGQVFATSWNTTRIWCCIEARAAAEAPHPAPALIDRDRRPSLALLSPLPPTRSGVATHTASICAELGKLVDLHVFHPSGSGSTPDPVPGAVTVRPMSDMTPDFGRTQVDRILCVMGNSDHHLAIFQRLVEFGGAVLAHDARMLGFYHACLGAGQASRVAARELGRPVEAAELSQWEGDEATLPTLFLSELADLAEPLIVHSAATAREVRQRYGREAVHLPFSLQRAWMADALAPDQRLAARTRLGIGRDTVLIVTFGFIHASKAPDVCIRALAALRAGGVPAMLCFVGAAGMDLAPLHRMAEALTLAPFVRLLDQFLSPQCYDDYLIAADLGIQLRRYGFGSISGALMDCLAAGLHTIANDGLADAIDAPPYLHRVADGASAEVIAATLASALGAGRERLRADAAWARFTSARDPAIYVRRLCASLALEAAWPGGPWTTSCATG